MVLHNDMGTRDYRGAITSWLDYVDSHRVVAVWANSSIDEDGRPVVRQGTTTYWVP